MISLRIQVFRKFPDASPGMLTR